MELLPLLQARHSIRRYQDKPIPQEVLTQILQAGLLAPSSRSRRPWELLVITDKEKLQALSHCRDHGAAMLQNANACVVVLGNTEQSDVWIEDCSLVLGQMHLMATALGVGSCWIQARLRTAEDGSTTDDYLRSLLHYPAQYTAEGILSLGYPAEEKTPTALTSLPLEKLHGETFGTPYGIAREDYLQNARYPEGTYGKHILNRMRESHKGVMEWTLSLFAPKADGTYLEVGCGGGRALKRLSALVPQGKLYGVDYAKTAVESTIEENRTDIASGKLTVLEGSVSALPFDDDTFDGVYSIESYYFWPDLYSDVKELYRVTKQGGRVLIAADIHGKENLDKDTVDTIAMLKMHNLTPQEMQQLLEQAGFVNVTVHLQEGEEWMCGEGMVPILNE